MNEELEKKQIETIIEDTKANIERTKALTEATKMETYRRNAEKALQMSVQIEGKDSDTKELLMLIMKNNLDKIK